MEVLSAVNIDQMSHLNGNSVVPAAEAMDTQVQVPLPTLPVYLLIAASQTFSIAEKEQTIANINSSLLQIGAPLLGVKDDLSQAIQANLHGNCNTDNEYRIAAKSDDLFDFELVVNSTTKSFKTALRSFFQTKAQKKYFITSGLNFNSSGDFLLQDGTFSYEDLLLLLGEESTVASLKEPTNAACTISVDVSAHLLAANKCWKNLERTHKTLTLCQTPLDTVNSSGDFGAFCGNLSQLLNERTLEDSLEESRTKMTGTLRINKPCLYIFPSRQGDAAYFNLSGYSILINGGYDRVKPSFWKFVSMLEQIDAVLITHSDTDALGGLTSFFAKKLANPEIKPKILTVLGNLTSSSPHKYHSEAAVSLATNLIATEAATATASVATNNDVDFLLDCIEKLELKLQPLVKSADQSALHPNKGSAHAKYEHMQLYFKMGQGSLDLYVLSPMSNSADLNEFVKQQQKLAQKHFNNNNKSHKSQLTVNQLFRTLPLAHLTSVVCLLVWTPTARPASKCLANENNVLRLLFTGNAPQHVVAAACDKVKDMDFLQTPTFKSVLSVPTVHHSAPAKRANVNGSMNNQSVTSTTSITNGVQKHTKASSNDNHEQVNGASKTTKPPTGFKPLESKGIKPAHKSASSESKDVTAKNTEVKPKPAKKISLAPTNGHKTEENGTAAAASEHKKPAARISNVAFQKKTPADKTSTASASSSTMSTSNGSSATAAPKPKPAPKMQPTKNSVSNLTAKSAEHTEKAKIGDKKPLVDKKSDKKVNEKLSDKEVKESRIITKRDFVKKAVPAKVEHKEPSAKAATMSLEVSEPGVLTQLVADVIPPVTDSEQVPEPDQIIMDNPEDDLVQLESVQVDEVMVEVPEVVSEAVEEVQVENDAFNQSLDTPNVEIEVALTTGTDVISCVVNDEANEGDATAFPNCPNLSPVKKDANGGQSFLESNNHREDLDTKNDGVNVLNDSRDSIKNQSFCEDNDEGIESSMPLDPVPKNLDDSELDLNKTHELSVDEADIVENSGAEQLTNGNHQEHVEIDAADILCDQLNLLKVAEQSHNGFVEEHISSKEEGDDQKKVEVLVADVDPAKWDILELPKPVQQPNDDKPADSDKKTIKKSPAGKKPVVESSSNTTTTSAPVTKPAFRQQNKSSSGLSKLGHNSTMHPIYVEVSYIPAHGDAHYVDSDFFRRVRARHYVLSAEEPTEHCLNALMEAKETWEDKTMQVSLIPTYESEQMRTWFTLNEEALAKLKIDIMPAAQHTELSMDNNPDLSLKVYKLEF